VFDEKFKSIGETIATVMIGGLKKVSDLIARSVVLGENLLNSFKTLAQQILINILSFLKMIIYIIFSLSLSDCAHSVHRLFLQRKNLSKLTRNAIINGAFCCPVPQTALA